MLKFKGLTPKECQILELLPYHIYGVLPDTELGAWLSYPSSHEIYLKRNDYCISDRAWLLLGVFGDSTELRTAHLRSIYKKALNLPDSRAYVLKELKAIKKIARIFNLKQLGNELLCDTSG